MSSASDTPREKEIPVERMFGPDKEARAQQALDLWRTSPLPERELLQNLGLYINRPLLTRMLFMHEMYTRVLEVHGVVMEFGCRWGQNLALFESFRGMYEPYNHTRKIVGFDTFEGFPTIDEQDRDLPLATVGAYDVVPGYETYLDSLLDYHESQSPLAEMRKYELVKGDVTATLPAYLDAHPETIIAFAYFDLDLYGATKTCLELIRPYLTKGSVVGFDELCTPEWAGETAALRETWGLAHRIVRSRTHSMPAYIVVE